MPEPDDPAESLRQAIESLGATGRMFEPPPAVKAIEQFGKTLSERWEATGAAEAFASFGAATADLDRLADLSGRLHQAYPAAAGVDWPAVADRLGPEADVPALEAAVDELVSPAQQAGIDALIDLERQQIDVMTDLVARQDAADRRQDGIERRQFWLTVLGLVIAAVAAVAAVLAVV